MAPIQARLCLTLRTRQNTHTLADTLLRRTAMSRFPSLAIGMALLAACATSHTSSSAAAAPSPVAASPVSAVALSNDDRIRIAEAFRLAAAVGDEIWPAWTSAPFAILLVTPE